MQSAFGRRILAGRTAALAARGVLADADLLPPHLVCVAGGRHVALPMTLVASIRPFQCHALPLVAPRAAAIVLGLAMIGHRLASVLDLAKLLSGASDDPATGGSMILLRAGTAPVAVRVDRVLGVMQLRAAADPDRGLMPAHDNPADPPELVTLLSGEALLASIAALDHA